MKNRENQSSHGGAGGADFTLGTFHSCNRKNTQVEVSSRQQNLSAKGEVKLGGANEPKR